MEERDRTSLVVKFSLFVDDNAVDWRAVRVGRRWKGRV
jgi:hypothetical protein